MSASSTHSGDKMKSAKYKQNISAKISWPDENELLKIRSELESDDIIGSSVLPKDASALDQFKFKLCEILLVYRKKSGLKQKDMAAIIGVDEARMSEILHYKIEKFTSDRLQEYVQKIYPGVKFTAIAA
jgi:predicted XRE-type DNA-binding protein